MRQPPARDLYLDALRAAEARPMRGDPDAALHAFLTLNAGYFLGEWLAPRTHRALVRRLAGKLDGLAEHAAAPAWPVEPRPALLRAIAAAGRGG